MAKEGWDYFKEPQQSELTKEQKAAKLEINNAFKACFSTPQGEEVLKYLQGITVDRKVLSVYHSDGVNTAIDMAFREGQNCLYRTIMHHINARSIEDE